MKYFKKVFIYLAIFFFSEGLTISSIDSGKTYLSASFNDSVQSLLTKSSFYFKNVDYDNAIIELYKLYSLRLKYLDASNPEIASSLKNLASIYIYKGEMDSAIKYLSASEKILTANKYTEPEKLGNLYSSMGFVFQTKGEYAYAEEYLKLSEKYFLKKKSDDMNLNILRLYFNFLSLYIDSKEIKKSKEYIIKAKKALDKINDNSQYLIHFYIRISLLEAMSSDISNSIKYQKKALLICEKDTSENLSERFSIYNNIGLDYLDINQFDLSLQYFNKALAFVNRFHNKGNRVANLYINYSYYYDKTNNLNKSLDYSQKAIKSLVPKSKLKTIFENPNFEEIPATQLALEIFKAKSNILYKLYLKNKKTEALDASINTGFLILSLIEEIRNGNLTYEGKIKINEHEDETFKTLADRISQAFLITGHKKYLESAYEVAERNKSSLLLSSLGELKAKKFGEIPEESLRKEKYLTKRIAFYKEQIYEEEQFETPDKNKIETWQDFLFNSQREYSKLIEKFEKEYPKYYSLKYQSKNYKLNDIQDIIPPKTSVIEYTLTDSLLHIMVISDKNCFYKIQRIDSSFYQLAKEYLSEFQDFDFSKQYYSGFTEFCWKSKELYSFLIEPIISLINDTKLIIVPDGILSYIPFETLIEKIPENMPAGYFKELTYLIEKYEISYAYSSQLINNDSDKGYFNRIKKVLAFAPEYNSEEVNLNNTRKSITRQKFRKNLYPIPGAMDEVNAISNLIETDLYSGTAATETNFKNVAEKYDILHLAMHTVIDNNNPMYSKLIFDLNADSINDGLLNTYEIFGLNLNARMVILSACSTGEGEYSKGEGALSLARGFAYAGVPSLVMTLWEVEDKSGSVLMKDFYKNLLKGQSKAKALQNAKIKFIQESKMENSHPFFWSSFVIVGNPSALDLPIYPLLIISAIILILILLYFIKRKKLFFSGVNKPNIFRIIFNFFD